MSKAVQVCNPGDISPGSFDVFETDSGSVVVGRTSGGEYWASRAVCPHHGARFSRGGIVVTPAPDSRGPGDYETVDRNTALLRCPWHGFSFDVLSGSCIGDASLAMKIYRVVLEGDRVVVDLSKAPHS